MYLMINLFKKNLQNIETKFFVFLKKNMIFFIKY